ncbi:MAG: aminotransferase class I/II-fold pyridoxal phosphate-dependent enzyme [Mariprofundus sp.]
MHRIDLIEPFRVMQLLERARQMESEGRHIVHMEIGEPDFRTPALIIAKAQEVLERGDTFYTPSTGLPELQQTLSSWYKQEYGLSIDKDRILITPGTSGAFSLLYSVLLDQGESVLLPDPGYPCQRNFIRLAGGEPVNIPVGPASRYHLSLDHLEKHWTEKTRAAVVISPSNPTGILIETERLATLANFCHQRDGYLISDEIYHGLTYGEQAVCALSYDDNAIVVNGFSKRWAMTGWRIGWVIVPENLIEPCRRVMQNIFIAAPTLSQHAAVTALSTDVYVEKMRGEYDKRRRYLLAELPGLGFDVVVEPEGAFYIYANVSGITDDSREFCWRILEEAGVALTPGEDFGTHKAEQHLRISYATSLENIREGIRRIRAYTKHTKPIFRLKA